MIVKTTSAFETLRPLLYGIAYKMTGSVEDSKDILQDVLEKRLRLSGTVENEKAYLAKAVANTALNYLKKQEQERKQYFGLWLPEPFEAEQVGIGQEEDKELSYGFLLLLEKLSPLERAVYLLRESFELPYSELAANFDINEAHCRQLYHRAKERLLARKRFAADQQHSGKVLDLFQEACLSGDLSRLIDQLKEDIVLYSDGGGKVPAAVNNIQGKESASKFLKGIYTKNGVRGIFRFAYLNSSPAAIVFLNGVPDTIAVLEAEEAGISAIYFVRNPDKIRHLQKFL